MPGIPSGTCQNCGAAVSYFARWCPVCGTSNLPNPVVTVLALAGLVVLGAAITFGSLMLLRGKDAGPTDAAPADERAGTGEQYGWLVQAMAECEAEAKRTPDKLFFLIVPVSLAPRNVPGWNPGTIGMVGAAELLPSTNAVLGLRNGALVLSRQPLAFAISDPATNTAYKWQPAVGVTVLTARDTGFKELRLGFQLPESKDIDWGFTISLTKGTCYWIYPMVRTAARSE